MATAEKWIWLSSEKYPNCQNNVYSGFSNCGNGDFTVAEFIKKYSFDSEVTEATLRVSGDTEFKLSLNGAVIATGPVNVGGDFLFNNEPRSKHYASEFTVYPGCCELDFSARVKTPPIGINEYSRGKGGFMLWGKLRLKNGRVKYITTDRTWLARCNKAYTTAYSYDLKEDTESFSPSCEINNIWHTETAPLEIRTEKYLAPLNGGIVEVLPHETKKVYFEFDKIYAGFVSADVNTKGDVCISLGCVETETVTRSYSLKFNKDGSYRGFQLESIGAYDITVTNNSENTAKIKIGVIETQYPVHSTAKIYTSDNDLNLVLDVCRHTLKSCRQMIHLDSPQHSEPLACTGDYYIESLMTSMSFGDMSLAQFDIVRTAELLRIHNGRMFHTTYSLIWVLMLWDIYTITGNKQLLQDCQDALYLLLTRFESYIGDNGLIETPPDFMFVDWIYIDGITMHHPPKALGQTSLCAFYYGALKAAEKIYAELNETAEKDYCALKSRKLKAAVNSLLFDNEKGLYFDGLNTPSPEEMLYEYLPQNVKKRYYMPHSNILCVCFGICEGNIAEKIIEKAVTDKEWGACQPYFKHYLLEAVFKLGICDKYTLRIIEEWKEQVKLCPKGLVEGFIKPEPAYSFDHSHAWGGTPLYSLPKAILGLRITEPGYKKIAISPNLLGLRFAHIEVPTPYGTMMFELENGKDIKYSIPEEIETEWL